MTPKQIKGLKYPDDYFIKFFFKERLHEKKDLRFLEFGCGNGSNLMLPYMYDNEVIGIDYNETLISYAKDNFNLVNNNQRYRFYSADMRDYAEKNSNINADVFSLPNIVNYISRTDFTNLLNNCKNNKLYKKNSKIFIRFRTPKDFRFGLGNRVNHCCYQIDKENNITGEAGALNCFYSEIEMVDILKKYLNLTDYKLFHIDFENIAFNGDTILNSDIVIWGTIS
jgi:SAM-dependent methyltransferase